MSRSLVILTCSCKRLPKTRLVSSKFYGKIGRTKVHESWGLNEVIVKSEVHYFCCAFHRFSFGRNQIRLAGSALYFFEGYAELGRHSGPIDKRSESLCSYLQPKGSRIRS